MSSIASRPDDSGACVKILSLSEDYAFGKIFRVSRATLQHRRFDGRLSAPVTRLSFDRGDSVGVLLYEPQQDAVILVRQFRYPVYASLAAEERAGEGAKRAWLLEIVAGVQEAGLTVQEVAHKELLEEAGYQIKGDFELIATMYPSPGGSSERLTLFLGRVQAHERVGKGGGVAAEGEDIQVEALPFQDAMQKIAQGEICDAKTILALQYLALLKAREANQHPA
jgi:ADP-ribose pyrophosphatase